MNETTCARLKHHLSTRGLVLAKSTTMNKYQANSTPKLPAALFVVGPVKGKSGLIQHRNQLYTKNKCYQRHTRDHQRRPGRAESAHNTRFIPKPSRIRSFFSRYLVETVFYFRLRRISSRYKGARQMTGIPQNSSGHSTYGT